MNHNRFDLKVLLASLIAASAVIGVFLVYESSVEKDKTLERATSAARLIRALPFSGLRPNLREEAYTRLLQHLAEDARFAYAQIDDGDGNIVSEVSRPSVVPPDLSGNQPTGSGWLDRIELPDFHGHSGFELRGPVSGTRVGGRYRIAFFNPSLTDVAGRVSFIAMMVLPIFMLVPLLLLLLRREIRPIKGLARTISRQKENASAAQLPVEDDVSGFVEQFNGFLDQAQKRMEVYRQERDKLVTAERFLNYRVLKLESILHAVNSGIAIIDHNGKATFCNELFAKYINLGSEEIVQIPPSNWNLPDEYREPLQGERADKWPTGHTADIDPQHLPGVTLRLSVHNIRKPNSEDVSGQVVVLTDVSGERLAHKSRGEFVGHVSHELKTPLNTLSLCVQSLLGPDGEVAQTRTETLNIIGDEVDRLATLINNLLSITQMEMGTLALKATRVRLSDLLNDAVSSVSRTSMAAGQKFSITVDEGVDTVQVDKPLFRIALNNLLTNAVKYSSNSGVVEVTASETPELLQISVSDNGIGIPAEEQELIFEKFSRGKGSEVSERPGHGLGLALTRDIIELHHGAISVQSGIGEGSTFTIELRKETGVLRNTL